MPIFATRDWHTENHCSFQEYGGEWPRHCIASTSGAAFPVSLTLPVYTKIISKATTQARKAYSAFSETQLHELLQSLKVKRLFVGGLATEYCVLNTVKDAIGLQYVIFLLEDAVCAMNQKHDDGFRALMEMKRLGAMPINYEELVL
ncbi:isochorismatase family protein [Nitrosomonas aestuarii]|uniref:isochorismatase family protein n=1 Tax=Nitrosomonas aestuarii TaxID=52441 RepID=UPI000D42826F|nr:isochorismatase family protein [Nitrosomonas aestuarii]PTN11618.1 nicotinamidase/pyrazinamidase [Nitrosomonas aestuarii]